MMTTHTIIANVSGMAQRLCELRWHRPTLALPPGDVCETTVLLCSGGRGDGFAGDQVGGPPLISAMQARGWHVLDRRWVGGWFAWPESILNASLRTLLMLDALPSLGVPMANLVGVGNSGGAAEIAYQLVSGESDHFARAVLCSGPPMTDLSLVCTSVPTSAWQQKCASLMAPYPFASPPACTVSQSGVLGPWFARLPGALSEESILHATNPPSAAPFALLVGELDSTGGAVPGGLLFADEVSGLPVAPTFVLDAGHLMQESIAGRQAILDAVRCVP